MFRIVSVILFIIALGSFVSAQETFSSCPTISVTASIDSVKADSNQDIFFIASISGELPKSQILYKWTVEEGIFVEGQGTKTIRVNTFSLSDSVIKATLNVIGLPEKCDNSAFATSKVEMRVIYHPWRYNIYKDSPLEEQNVELDNLMIVLQKNPDLFGVIKATIKQDEKTIETKRHFSQLISHLRLRRYNLKKVFFVIEKSDSNETFVYLIKDEKELSDCKDCEIIKASDVK